MSYFYNKIYFKVFFDLTLWFQFDDEYTLINSIISSMFLSSQNIFFQNLIKSGIWISSLTATGIESIVFFVFVGFYKMLDYCGSW